MVKHFTKTRNVFPSHHLVAKSLVWVGWTVGANGSVARVAIVGGPMVGDIIPATSLDSLVIGDAILMVIIDNQTTILTTDVNNPITGDIASAMVTDGSFIKATILAIR